MPLASPGHYLPVVVLGDRSVAGPPLTLSSSPEFRMAAPGEGRRTLARVASIAGGGEVADLTRVWTMATADGRENRDLAAVFLWCCIALFLLELAGRRLELFS
ncbi:MAG: hypothetical protein LUE17_18035 [Planctomycetaceae bacterium]|nr:hypothetical protein [Planctomycetaceae bacterium]